MRIRKQDTPKDVAVVIAVFLMRPLAFRCSLLILIATLIACVVIHRHHRYLAAMDRGDCRYRQDGCRKLTHAVNDASAMQRFWSSLIARHGKLVSESYFGDTDATTRFDVHSIATIVVGLIMDDAISSGRLSSLDAKVGDYIGTSYSLDAGDRAVPNRVESRWNLIAYRDPHYSVSL
jgi:hypothetical protein